MKRRMPKSFQIQPDPQQCCDACVFKSGKHADWCPVAEAWRQYYAPIEAAGGMSYQYNPLNGLPK
jgi:hypothetical protein